MHSTKPWQLPQHELVGRPELDDSTLYRRRESAFAWLTAWFVSGLLVAALAGVETRFGLGELAAALHLDLGTRPELALAAIVSPLSAVALTIVLDLFGARRVAHLIAIGVTLLLGVIGMAWTTDRVIDVNGATTSALPGTIAIALALATSSIVQALVIGASGRRARGRRIGLRHVAGVLVGAATGWGMFAVAHRELAVAGDATVIGMTAAAYVGAAGVLAAPIIAAVVAILSRYLRIAVIVPAEDDEDVDLVDLPAPVFTRRRRPAMIVDTPIPGAFTTAEHAFFDAGDDVVPAGR